MSYYILAVRRIREKETQAQVQWGKQMMGRKMGTATTDTVITRTSLRIAKENKKEE